MIEYVIINISMVRHSRRLDEHCQLKAIQKRAIFVKSGSNDYELNRVLCVIWY